MSIAKNGDDDRPVLQVIGSDNAPPGRTALRIFSLEEFRTLPPPSWIVDGIIPATGLVALFGRPGSGKTFVALDLAVQVCLGGLWGGQPVTKGAVVYVAGEGGRFIPPRIEAIESVLADHERSALGSNLHFINGALQLANGGDLELIAGLAAHQHEPALIIIDTLARCFCGYDENSSKDMGLMVDACGHLSEQTGAAILLVHHSGKSADKVERGSSALRGAADAMLLVDKTDDTVLVKCSKMKDAMSFPPIAFSIVEVELGSSRGDSPKTSCRLSRLTGPPDGPVEKESRPPTRSTQDRVLATFLGAPPCRGFTGSELVESRVAGKSATYRALASLHKLGTLELVEGPSEKTYRLASKDQGSGPSPTPPKGEVGLGPEEPSP